jgi:uncharacterized protein
VSPRRRSRQSRRRSPHWIGVLLLGALLGAGVGIGIVLSWHGRPSHPGAPEGTGRGRPRQETAQTPRPAAPPEAPLGPAIGPGPETPAREGEHPRVAIIFDDAGYSLRAAEEVMTLGRPLTISVLPGLPFSTPIAEQASTHGVQVILHLPMEPVNSSIPLGPGGIVTAMTDAEIEKTVADDFSTVPTAVGANNHMGSLGTSDPRVMRDVIGVIKTRHLFFVDSLTSPHSVAAQVAREMDVPTAVRAVFLDGQNDEAYVRGQLHLLLRLAESRGQAIAIGHVGKVTAGVLRAMLPEFDEAGVQFVPVSQLVH